MYPDGFNGKPQACTDVFPPEDRARVWQKLQDMMSRHETDYADDYRLTHPDGTVHWMSVTGRLYYDEQGQAVRMIGVVQDISERKRTEQNLRENEARFRTMAEAVPSFLFETDAEGRNIWTSEGWCRFTGQTPMQVVGHGWAEALHPDDRAANIDRWVQCMEEGVPFESQQRLRRSDGTYAWVMARALPVRDDQGFINRWVGSVTDVDGIVRAQNALRESKDRLEGLVTSAMDAVITIDADHRIVLFNPAAERMFGYLAGDVLGSSVDRFIPGTLQAAHRAHVEQFGKDGTTDRRMGVLGTISGVRANGQEFPIEASISQMMSGGKHLFTVILRDITDRKRVEEELRQSEERWRLAVTGATDGIWDWNIVNHTVFLSSRWKELRGYPEEEIGIDETEWSSRIHPEDYSRVMAAVQSYLNRNLRVFDCEYRTRCKDGRYLWIADRGVAIWDEQGRAIRMVGSETDITERKLAEDALRESEARYRATFANAAVGIGRVAFHNATWIDVNEALCRLVGYSREEMLRTPWPTITHPEDLDLDLVPFRRMAEGRLDSYTVEKRFIHKQGHDVWARLTLSLVRDAEGHPLYEICIAEDIQERKWAESILMEAKERLEHWNQELEQAVHERTAELHQSQAQLRALARELTLTEQRERKHLATELHDHLQQMLVVGKLTIGQGKRHAIGMPQCEAVFKKVDDILSEALAYSRTLVADLSPPVLRDHGLVMGIQWLVDYMKQKHEHSVTVLVPEGTKIEVSEDQTFLLFQSVRELLINSAKYAGIDEATVTLESQQGSLVITVSDRGNGFDLAAAAAAAENLNGGLSSKFGLFSIQERMRALGGTFEIQSAPGQGTIARLTLPFGGTAIDATREGTGLNSDLSRPEDAALSPLSSVRKQEARIRVLLVDDHTLIRQSLGAMLNGYPDMMIVGEAANGEEALRLVEELQPAVVVMDINMPKMDGIEATGRITLRHPDIAVIGLSVNAGGENQEAMNRAGAIRLMTKESAMEELYSAIQEAVKG